MLLDSERSAEVARKVNRQIHHCWRNAYLSLFVLPSEAVYVEGWAVLSGGRLFEHGWIELEGSIIDPTLYDDPRQPAQYFSALRFTRSELARAVEGLQVFTVPRVWAVYGPGGLICPEYQAAHRLAERAPHRKD